MATINAHYRKLKAGYLFPEIGRRVKAFAEANPQARVIRLGIGDVVRPLVPVVVKAFRAAVDEMGTDAGFRGYGPEQGYDFLRLAICEHDFKARGALVEPDEVFVSDGSKCDCGNVQEIFALDSRIAVSDPVYPVYVDTNVMAGRTGEADASGRYGGLVYMPCTEANGFAPAPPEERADLVYLCSPNNPTGAVLTHVQLAEWVAWARKHEAVILFDAAYEAFISRPDLPRSIYEIPGSREVAIEFRSYSKTAGFTGTRCAFIVIPKELKCRDGRGGWTGLNALWNRRHCTKFNGVAYPVQRAAEAVYSAEGRREVREIVAYYMENARIIREALSKKGLRVFGGVDAPYIWMQTPGGMPSWDFFDLLLKKANVVGTPGAGFGAQGEGYLRLSSFAERKNVQEAVERIVKIL